jgi:hypothetical protein
MDAVNEINVDDTNKPFIISLSTAVSLLDDRVCLIKQHFRPKLSNLQVPIQIQRKNC